MSYTVTQESFDSLASHWDQLSRNLNYSSVFVLPAWMNTWWQVFGGGAELYLRAVRQGEKAVGLAPLMLKEGRASIIGSADVCDYLDFVVAPGVEADFFSVLLDDLKQKNVRYLDLEGLRPDSTVLTSFTDLARKRGCEVFCQPVDVTLELDLPNTWEEYLEILTAKQRHEVRRKLRRLLEAGKVNYHFANEVNAVRSALDIFLNLFTGSRSDKAAFLTSQRESFFRTMSDAMSEAGILRIGILELDSVPTAMIMYFDYSNCIYLYNSGYDPLYESLSVGLLSKVLCIKESIQEGKKKFDFLKGNEIYKSHLGGREIPLYRCQINIR
jgi:CelD/BcsL family acetyltransferase involved in cellulose biosynthesis